MTRRAGKTMGNGQALKTSEERYGFLFDHLPIALWRASSDVMSALFADWRKRGIGDVPAYLDANPDVVRQAMDGTHVTAVNARTVQVFGAHDPHELLGPEARFWKDSLETYKKILVARFNGGEAFQAETHLTTLDGQTVQGIYFQMAFPPALRGPGVSLDGFLDETDRLRAQSRLAAIISSSDDAIVGKTPVGIVTSWNAGAAKIFGYDAHEMIGQSIMRIIPAELHPEERDILRRIALGERIKNYETVRRTKDGRDVHISLTVSPVLDPAGKVVGASKIARDVTAEKHAAAELQQVQNELARVTRVTTLGEMTAAIAHEVNQPLASIVSSANASLRWLANDPPNVPAARASIERLVAAGNHAADVIMRVRALIAKTPPRREAFSINEAIMEVVALVQGELARHSIALQTVLASDVPTVLGDRIQLQQVILNLVLNAIDAVNAAAPPRDVAVTSAPGEADDVVVTVRDSGVGFDEKALPRLFDAFYTTKPQGMGIGLAVSRTIVHTHGGVLRAQPNTPRGAVFTIRLPVNSEPLS